MPSPFPGMDPYLEAHWGDVHSSLVIYARDALQARLPDDLRARVEERVFVESHEGQQRTIYPDVRVIERPHAGTFAETAGGVALSDPVTEPMVIHVPQEAVTESFIEIREAGSGHRVITTIEFVSVANKQPGVGRDLYQKKQREMRAGGVNIVEIDLLRAGLYVLCEPQHVVPRNYRTPYCIGVWRANRPDRFEYYPVPLEQRLPTIRIPLRPTDADATLPLQALLEQCYRNGGYDDLDYRAEPDPPLAQPEAAWADELLKVRGLRTTGGSC